MITNYQKMLLDDLNAPQSYGKPLIAWKGQTEFFRGPAAPKHPGALPPPLPTAFVEETYVLVMLQRPVTVYRGFETQGLKAPFGQDHPSFYLGLVNQRQPGKPDGMWWSPARPSLSIDNLGLGSLHREQDRSGPAVKLEWNRIDYYLEAELSPRTLVYAGRAAPQQESALYGGRKLGGGGMQFRLTAPPEQAFKWMKRYTAS